MLASHPLKEWIDEVIKLDWPKDEPTSKSKSQKKDARASADKWLADKLKITKDEAKNATSVGKALGTKDLDECKKLWAELSNTFTRTSRTKTALQTALQNKFPGQF
ncbi:hypothetical protein D3C86_1804310 [compost metagenome]